MRETTTRRILHRKKRRWNIYVMCTKQKPNEEENENNDENTVSSTRSCTKNEFNTTKRNEQINRWKSNRNDDVYNVKCMNLEWNNLKVIFRVHFFTCFHSFCKFFFSLRREKPAYKKWDANFHEVTAIPDQMIH